MAVARPLVDFTRRELYWYTASKRGVSVPSGPSSSNRCCDNCGYFAGGRPCRKRGRRTERTVPCFPAGRPFGHHCRIVCGPIKHIVIIVKENHSFDNLFGKLPHVDGTTRAHDADRVIKMGTTPDSWGGNIQADSGSTELAINHGKMNLLDLSGSSGGSSSDRASRPKLLDIPA
jgi:Phosphoesterase family